MHYHWSWLIVLYLFLAGVSAGAFVISGFATYLGLNKYETLAKLSAFVAPFPVIIGLALLLLDLGRPFAFYRLFTTVQITSPMSIGAWLLTFFVIISLINLFLWLPGWVHRLVKLPWNLKNLFRPSRWEYLNVNSAYRWKRILSAIGFPIALGVGIYTGILLGAVSARPFWNTPTVAQLFLFSALSSGTAVILLLCCVTQYKKDRETFFIEKQLVLSLDIVFIFLEIFIIIPFILHNSLSTLSQAKSLHLILGGQFTGWFWIGVVLVGLIIPLVIEIIEIWPLILHRTRVHHSRAVTLITVSMILIGGFILRSVFVFAGQVSHFLPYPY